jgi:hypothetical protein
MMEIIATVVKYIFVIGVGVEVALILRSLFLLAREKARGAQAPVRPAEE